MKEQILKVFLILGFHWRMIKETEKKFSIEVLGNLDNDDFTRLLCEGFEFDVTGNDDGNLTLTFYPK